jgi:hypothetical protein
MRDDRDLPRQSRERGQFRLYAYAPLSQAAYLPHTGLAGWLRLIIWLALISLWALASLRVLRPSPEASPRAELADARSP